MSINVIYQHLGKNTPKEIQQKIASLFLILIRAMKNKNSRDGLTINILISLCIAFDRPSDSRSLMVTVPEPLRLLMHFLNLDFIINVR